MSEIERRNVSLNTQSFNACLSALVHCNEVKKAFELFSLSQSPQSSIETFGTLLLATTKDKVNGLEKCGIIWSELIRRFEPNLYCYNTLLLCIRDGGIPSHMLRSSNSVTCLPMINSKLHYAKKDSSVVAEKEVSWSLPMKDNSPLNILIYISKYDSRWIKQECLAGFLQSLEVNNVKPDIRTISILSSMFPDFDDLLLLSKKHEIKLDHAVFKSASQFRRILGDISNAKVFVYKPMLLDLILY